MKSYIHVALVLDASGSMSGLEKSTVSTMREFFESLKSDEDKTVVDVWQFDDKVVHIVCGEDISNGSSAAIENYSTGGCTALHDAICTAIDELGAKFAAMAEEDRPDGVVVAILTDGLENASRKFTVDDVKSRIEHQTSKYSWEFRFLAANQNAVLTGESMGLGFDKCMSWDAMEAGMKDAGAHVAYCCMSIRESARTLRSSKKDGTSGTPGEA